MEAALPRQKFEPRQMLDGDVLSVYGSVKSKKSIFCYISAPQQMRDHFEQLVRDKVGLNNDQVRANSIEDDLSQKPLWGDGSNSVFS